MGTPVAVCRNVGRILLGVIPDLEARFRAILRGYEPTFVSTLQSALTELRSAKYDMVIVGVLFDESRMFDLLRQVHAMDKDLPLVCVRSRLAISSPIVLEGLEVAVKALGANAFLDLQRFADDAEGNARLRRLLDDLLADVNATNC